MLQMKTVIFLHYLLLLIYSCWKGQVWSGLAHCSLLVLSAQIHRDLSWQHTIWETDLPVCMSLEVCLFTHGHCWAFTDHNHLFLKEDVRHKIEHCQMRNAGIQPPSLENRVWKHPKQKAPVDWGVWKPECWAFTVIAMRSLAGYWFPTYSHYNAGSSSHH